MREEEVGAGAAECDGQGREESQHRLGREGSNRLTDTEMDRLAD